MKKITLTEDQLAWLARYAANDDFPHAPAPSVADLAAGLRRKFGLEVSVVTMHRLLAREGIVRLGNRWRLLGE